ncbi:unnamed protein product [Rhizoctonia solani]|uniref:Uncharacterized protein n=1 Tax=Rhizoctonia solani TaxID=456999 RepID=A0A8H2XQB6_9AGAM|nr:unnamed protein product [Rhizoctonia solani]
MQDIRRVLTDQKNNTIAVEIDTAVIKDLWASLTRLTGEAPLNVVPLVKRWDDLDGACARTANTTLPGDLQEGINRCVQAAKGK